MKKEEIVNLNRTLMYVSFGGMSKAGKSIMMKNIISLDKIVKDFESSMKLALERFKPSGIDDLMKKDRTKEEQKNLDEMVQKVDQDLRDYERELLSEDIEVDIHSISESDFDEMVDATSNLTAGNFMYLRNFLVENKA